MGLGNHGRSAAEHANDRPRDYLQLQGIYTQGALRYLMQNPNSNWWYQDGHSAAFGILSDGVYGGSVLAGNATNIQLTTAGVLMHLTNTSGTRAGAHHCTAAMQTSATTDWLMPFCARLWLTEPLVTVS